MTGRFLSFAKPRQRGSLLSQVFRPGRSLSGACFVIAAMAIAGTAAGGREVLSADITAQSGPPIAIEDFVASTDDFAFTEPGCDAITVFDSSDGSIVYRGPQRISPGQLATTSDARLIVTLSSNSYPWRGFIHVLRWQEGTGEWSDGLFEDAEHLNSASGGAVAISPDDETLLVAWENAVAKYAVRNVTSEGLGPVVGSAPIPKGSGPVLPPTVVAAIAFSSDSRTAHIVATDGNVHTLDVATMSWRDDPIPYARTAREKSNRTRRTYVSISPDERWLVVNTGDQRPGQLNRIDLLKRESAQIAAPGVRESWGVAFNYAGDNRGLLAVHGRNAVHVFSMLDGNLEAQARISVPRLDDRVFGPAWGVRIGALAWSGSGDRIIAATGVSPKEWAVVEFVRDDGPRLRLVTNVAGCVHKAVYGNLPLDVVTIQSRHKPSPSPVPTEAPTTSPTPAASATPTRTSTSTMAPPTLTASPSPTRTSSPTAVPAAVYLPIALREHCDPVHERSDIALVLDTSSSMTGRKLEDAKEAALLFVGLIDLAPGRSQVAVVRYDREAELVRQLTRSRALVEVAIRNLHVRSGTHIDKGLRAALGELQSQLHVDRNMPVMILLTDGLQTGTPGEELRAAAEVKAAGVRLYTIGLGEDVDEAALRTMAGSDDRYYHAPDSADLASIYAEIAQDLMCPGKELWGGR